VKIPTVINQKTIDFIFMTTLLDLLNPLMEFRHKTSIDDVSCPAALAELAPDLFLI
jgi:hypothetical protein